MYRKRFMLMLVCWLVVTSLQASPIGERQALDIATRFLSSRAMAPSAIKMAHKGPRLSTSTTDSHSSYYIFNAGARGFVIVAGDDRVPAVLGYSDSCPLDTDDMPAAMQEWLEGYAAQIEAITGGAKPDVRSSSRPAIAPLLNVHWGQGMPYNVLLPHISGSNNAHAYVGCVAVAMAQVMSYWQYPSRPTQTIPGYTSASGKTYAVSMPSLQPMDFDWENMRDTYYTTDSTSAACRAVADLMLYSTTSLQSNFGPSSTGSLTRYIPERLITYFGYKNSAHYIYRNTFSTQAWEDTIYNELAAGRPVAYGGNKLSAGHAFVCDGYDGEGRFHINWGWAGKSNGYFLLNLLNPSDEGIGSAAGAYGYVYNQGAAIGLEPADGTDGTPAFSFEDLSISTYSSTCSAASSNFSVSVSGKFVNNTNASAQFRQGWGLYDLNGELLEVLFTRYSTNTVGTGGYITVSSRALSFGAGITSGTYRILPIYSIYPSEDYRPCIGSDVNYIEVTFGGNYSCTIKGYGTAGSSTRYTVNSCTTEGTLNHGKPVTVTLDLSNTGTSTNDMVYMLVDGEFTAMGLANIAAGAAGSLVYRFTPTTAGTKTLTFSLNENGVPALYTHKITISTMPSATLDVNYRIQGITDEENRIISADRYSIIVDVTNTGTTTYDEEFSVRLYRVNNEETNVGTELLSQTQPLHLAAGQSTSLQFDFDHDLIDGWKYFCYLYYYSNGETVGKSTKWYQLNLTGEPVAPVTRYTVTTDVLPSHGGRVSLSGRFINGKIQPGEVVTVTTLPNVAWRCQSITASDASGNPVVMTDAGDGVHTFVMPEGDVTVTAAFARSTGSRFRLVESRADITEGDTYVLVSRNYDKVMKHWDNSDGTIQATDIAEWLDDDHTIVRIGDDALFFTMTQMADTTVSSNARTAAYLTNGNAHMRTSNYNVLMQDGIVAESRAWMYIGNASNCLIRFKDTSSGSNGNWIVRYDNANDNFKVMNWNVTGAEVSRVWLYKLMLDDEPQVLPGDVNSDGVVNISDVTALIDYLLNNNDADINTAAADVNGDSIINISDVTLLIDRLLGN